MLEVCPFSVADTLHVPASGSFRTQEPSAAVPVTVLPLFVAFTAAPDVTETTRDMILPPCGYFPGIEPGKFLNSEFYKSKPGAKPRE